VSRFIRALTSAGLALQDSAGTAIIEVGNSANTHPVKVNGVLQTSGGVTLGTNVGTTTGSVNAASIVQLRPVSGTGGIVESLVGGENLILRGRTTAAPTGNIILGGLGEYAAVETLRALNASLPFHDSAGAEHALLTSTGLRIRPRVVTTSITAELDGVYHGTAEATYTDPTPAEGRGYLVRVVNGTQTVGGTAYAAEGTVIFREYHSGSWRNRVLFGGADAAAVRTNLGVQAAPVTTTTSQSTSYSWQPAQNGDVLKLTLTGAVALTLSDPATATVPLHVTVEAIQDGTGGRVLTLAGNVSTPGAVNPTLSATANAIDLLQFVWTGAKWRWTNSSYAQGNL
jgi:hypothetical protein